MDKETLIRNLNGDLARELTAVIQYLTYAAKVHGPYRPQLKSFFEAEIPDETAHAQFLAQKIAALGGEPTTTPEPVPEAKTNQEMLQEVFKAESAAVENYTRRAAEAEAFGDKGLQVQLEDMVLDETKHREETQRILRDWGLEDN
ncbi:MAG: ferritin-like domain-containing protein [Phycisphaerales bacterium JB037]